ncbi:MAG: hypothetical protein KBT21_08575 [Treponema sp.]|nr:hypothetical protein [Candidatus Treponema merdequi]
MEHYNRLQNFLVLLFTDDKDTFCKAYSKISEPHRKINGNNCWNLVTNYQKVLEEARIRQRKWKQKQKEKLNAD